MRRWSLTAVLLLAAVLLGGGVGARPSEAPLPAPAAVLGFEPGTDYRLADFGQLRDYFHRLDAASDRVKVFVAGRSTGGNEILVAAISSAENLRRLDEYRDISRRLALAREPSPDAARELARRGKAIVWIDNGLHATEVATSQHAITLAHALASREDAAMRNVRENVVLLLLPCVNPDGMDMVVDWYRRHRGTPHQDSPLPWLYQSFVGHDNNRDFFMQTQPETEVLSRLLYREWLPQVMYNQHQGIWPARMFVPPFPEPVNPHIDPQVMRGVDAVGRAIEARLMREGRDGIVSRYAFSAWYNGSIRTASYFHNIIGILTEVSHASATPHFYDPRLLPQTFSNGVSAREPSETYKRPWLGGALRLRDSLEYMLGASLAVLEYAAERREELLFGIHEMGRRQIALGASQPPVAYVIPTLQHDRPVAMALLDTLMKGGIEVHQAVRPFTAGGSLYAPGTHVILLAQAFRPFARDLIEPQRYPDVRDARGHPVPPYDAAGWTLAFQMGVRVVPVQRPFDTSGLRPLQERPRAAAHVDASAASAWGYAIDPSDNAAFTAVNRLLAGGARVDRLTVGFEARAGVTLPPGTWVVSGTGTDRVAAVARELGLRAWAVARPPDVPAIRVAPARVGVYRSWVANIDEGWTRWVLEQHEVPYRSVSDRDVRAGHLREQLDVIVLPAQDRDRILRGHRPDDRPAVPGPWGPVPPEYQGGMGDEGVEALREFAEAGGTVVAFDAAADLVRARFGGAVSAVASTTEGVRRETFFCPGSLVRIVADREHPGAWGMAPEAAAFFQNSRAFRSDDPAVRALARYATADRLLMSGWLQGEQYLAGQDAVVEVPFGRGRVVLFGFRPHFRGQSHGTFKLLLNALMKTERSADSGFRTAGLRGLPAGSSP